MRWTTPINSPHQTVQRVRSHYCTVMVLWNSHRLVNHERLTLKAPEVKKSLKPNYKKKRGKIGDAFDKETSLTLASRLNAVFFRSCSALCMNSKAWQSTHGRPGNKKRRRWHRVIGGVTESVSYKAMSSHQNPAEWFIKGFYGFWMNCFSILFFIYLRSNLCQLGRSTENSH